MTGYRLSAAARADLGEIWDYTHRHWGAAQADRYIRRIQAACEGLAAGHQTGTAASAIRPGYRKLRVASHILFFRRNAEGGIELIRVLHHRMDVAGRLQA